MMYWGGVDLVLFKCVCGLDNLCVDFGYGCNCDKNDNVWREDSGLFINKFEFFVMQLRFGDSSVFNEKGYYMFGKLKCYGVI